MVPKFSSDCSTQSRQSAFWNRLERPLGALLLTMGLALSVHSGTFASERVPASSLGDDPLVQAPASTAIAPVEASSPFADGIYLYGQSPEPDQTGSAYLVFEVRDRLVVGAFYMPHSSFDCFHGQVEAQQLALTIIDSYEQQAYPYAIALTETSTVAATDASTVVPVALDGYYALDQISENDHRILGVCQADYHDGL
jgi:hypothetical protein